MEKLVQQYIKLLSSPGNASDHFWELEKRIKRDKKHPGVLIELSKSDAIWDIAMFVQKKVIKMEDLEGFGDDLRTHAGNSQKDASHSVHLKQVDFP